FFFQAEDGIRDFHVTGVQTCALPISCQFGGGLGPPTEPNPPINQPSQYALRLTIVGITHLGIQSRLTQPLFKYAGTMKKLIRNNRVKHAHASLVEDAHYRLSVAKSPCEPHSNA